MPQRSIVTLGGVDLPPHFSYRPYIPRKRITITATADSVVTQASYAPIVHGDGTIPWTCPSARPTEFQDFWTLYNQTELTLLTFKGYWGEEYEVYFRIFDEPQVRSRLFDLSGQFLVASVTTDFSPECTPPGFPS